MGIDSKPARARTVASVDYHPRIMSLYDRENLQIHFGFNAPAVYLAGPVSGHSYGEASKWRADMYKKLFSAGIICYSPMRGSDHLLNETELKDAHEEYVQSTQRAIQHRCFYDVQKADLVLVNFLEAKKPSIGTVMEVAWAYALQKPVIAVINKNDEFHEHAMLRESFSYRVSNLDDAVKIATTFLLPV